MINVLWEFFVDRIRAFPYYDMYKLHVFLSVCLLKPEDGLNYDETRSCN